jgi:hypothetical protein
MNDMDFKSEEMDFKNEEMDFGKIFENFEESLVAIKSGDVVKGRIIGFNHNEVFCRHRL